VCVHPWCPGRGFEDVHLLGLEDGVEGGGVVVVSVAEQEAHRVEARAEIGGEVPCLVNRPVPGRMRGDAGDVQPSCAVLEEGQCVEARAVSRWKKSTAMIP
jgi:hypothetical protein